GVPRRRRGRGARGRDSGHAPAPPPGGHVCPPRPRRRLRGPLKPPAPRPQPATAAHAPAGRGRPGNTGIAYFNDIHKILILKIVIFPRAARISRRADERAPRNAVGETGPPLRNGAGERVRRKGPRPRPVPVTWDTSGVKAMKGSKAVAACGLLAALVTLASPHAAHAGDGCKIVAEISVEA